MSMKFSECVTQEKNTRKNSKVSDKKDEEYLEIIDSVQSLLNGKDPEIKYTVWTFIDKTILAFVYSTDGYSGWRKNYQKSIVTLSLATYINSL